jgi:putative PEP-CTERM system TPR-repeat lipoprotein
LADVRGPHRLACLALALAALFWAGPARAASTDDDNVEKSFEYYERALEYFEQHDYAAATIESKNALKVDQSNVSARLLLGRAYLRTGKGDAAEIELKRARRDGVDENLVLVPLGEAYLLQRKFAELLREMRGGNRAPGIEADIQQLRGEAYLQGRRFGDAETAFQASARLRPGSAEPLLGQARVAISRGKLAVADELAERAALMAPENANAWYTKGEIRRHSRDWPGAIENFSKALDLDPGFLRALIGRAASLIDNGRVEEAREDIEAVRDVMPEDPRAAYLHALVLAKDDDLRGARAALEQAATTLKQYPPSLLEEFPAALLLAGTIEFSRRRPDTAQHYLNKFVKVRPRHSGARRMLATILLQKGEAKRAFEILRPVLGRKTKDATLFAIAGAALMRDGQHSKASRYLERAVELAPDQATFRTQLGLSRLAAGGKAAAIDDLLAAFNQDRSATRPGILLGMIHFRNGEMDKAFEIASELIERQPDNPFPYNLAGGALMALGFGGKARLAFEEALKFDPSYLPAQFNLVKLDQAAGDRAAVKARLTAIVENHPKETRAMQQLSRLAEGAGDLAEAARWLEKSRAVNRRDLPTRVRLVELYLQQKDLEKAMEVAEAMQRGLGHNLLATEVLARVQLLAGQEDRAVKLLRDLAKRAGKSVDRLYRIGGLQRRAGDLDGARETFKRLLTLDPVHEPTHSALIATLLKQGEEEEALAAARGLRSAHPASAVGDILEGDVHVWRRRYRAAVDLYTRALAKTQNAALLARLYKARRALGEGGEALGLLELWLQSHPKDRDLQMLLASAYVEAKRPDDAIRLYERLSAAAPNEPALLNNLAGLYQAKGDRRALPLARRALALAPREAAVLDTVGWILVQQGDAKAGLSHLRRAHSRAAAQPEIRYHLAAALARLGKTAEARRHLEGIIAAGTDAGAGGVTAKARALLDELP